MVCRARRPIGSSARSGEGRGGEEGRSWGAPDPLKKKKEKKEDLVLIKKDGHEALKTFAQRLSIDFMLIELTTSIATNVNLIKFMLNDFNDLAPYLL